MMMPDQFGQPWAFLLLLLVPFVLLPRGWWRRRATRQRNRPAWTLSTTAAVAPIGRTLRTRLLWLPPLLRAIACIALVGVIARPQDVDETQTVRTEGVAIQIVVDRSGSMMDPMPYGGSRVKKMDVVREVLAGFVEQRSGDPETGGGDMIGLIAFGTLADTLAPMSRSATVLEEAIDRLNPYRPNTPLAATAIGDGIALAAARLQRIEARLAASEDDEANGGGRGNGGTAARDGDGAGGRDSDGPPNDFHIRSKVIVLLTDGTNNAGEVAPDAAAALCRDWDITIYAIGIGQPASGFRSRGGFDGAQLERLADATMGQSWTAASGDALEKVIRTIDRLEPSTIQVSEQANVAELYPPLAMLALCLLAGEILLRSTLVRRTL